MKTTAEVLYMFFSVFNVLVAGICLGRILARHERKSKQAEETAAAAPTFVVFVDLSGCPRGGLRKESPPPSGEGLDGSDDPADDAEDPGNDRNDIC